MYGFYLGLDMEYFCFLKVCSCFESYNVPLGMGLTGFTDSPLVCSPHVAGLRVFAELVEPGLLGLAALCSCDRAVFIPAQAQEH